MLISLETAEKIRLLEESLWYNETRFDREYMEALLAPDFFEFGRSGKIYSRADTLASGRQHIHARFPLKDFSVHAIAENVVLTTYMSEVQYDTIEIANRSSLWVMHHHQWQLRFHQGTPVSK
jgi:hypothetical protein